MTDQIDVLVTAIGGFSHGEQILKALLEAPGYRYRLHGADARSFCPQFAMVDTAHQLPLASEPEYLDALLSLCKRFNVRALFHGSEPELKFMSENRALLKQEGILVPINPPEVISLCMDKAKTNQFLLRNGFSAPSYHEITNLDVVDAVERFPVIVKPSIGGGGSADVYIAQSRDELAAVFRLVEDRGSLMVQEYVGRPEDEYTIGILHDLDGKFVNSIAVRRDLNSSLNVRISVPNRTDRTDLGPKLVVSSGISHGEIGPFPEVTQQCEAMAKAIGAAGPVNIQARLVDGVVMVFEINPRFSGTTSLRAKVGFNEPDLLIRRHLFDEELETRFHYKQGTVLRSLVETVIQEQHHAQ